MTEVGRIWRYGKLRYFKQETNARKWHANIKRCEIEKKIKTINDPHVYGTKHYI